MKFLLVLACLLVAANALDKKFLEEFKHKMQEIGAKCVDKEKPADDDVALLISHQMPSTHEGKCVIACVYQAYNTINDDGTINVDEGIKALQPLKENDEEIYNKIVTIFKKCSSSITLDGDRCNTGFNLIDCSLKEGRAIGINHEDFL